MATIEPIRDAYSREGKRISQQGQCWLQARAVYAGHRRMAPGGQTPPAQAEYALVCRDDGRRFPVSGYGRPRVSCVRSLLHRTRLAWGICSSVSLSDLSVL